MEQIPLVNLSSQYAKIKDELLAKIQQVIESRQFIQGPFATEFENAFLKSHQAPYGIPCSNGTAAISLVLEALGIGRGHEVITTTNTFIATVEAICHVGAKPVLVDIDPDTYCMDPHAIEAAITNKTKAIIPVHIYGNPCEMDTIMTMAKKHNLAVIEDSAQAHLAMYKGQYVGTFGEGATFSFYPGKNLGAFGDAGFIFTKSEGTLKHIRRLIDHGRVDKYFHDIIGYNHRMDGIQAAILSVKLQYLEEWTETRIQNARTYDSLLEDTGVKTLKVQKESKAVYHLYPVQVSNRDEVASRLKERGIATGIHYPVPLHLQPALKELGYKKGQFPAAENLASRILSLPMCGELQLSQIEFICREFKSLARP